ncbi:MAG TPA: SAM-dependent methyltransferase [Steroidobacteraceae bacterium]|jgi:SAM-dependent MidA family methyltransferase|nr:SAM-dependent methyltransferase [Steroidobacteraceae bacterium]
MLPALNEAEAAHSAALRAQIIRRIRASADCIDFETFMELALYAPGLGYYSAGSTKLGAAGDFTTAPEISALFGRCVARQCAQILRASGGDSVLELGAGTGSMAATILRELAASDALPTHYDILEVSADLAQRQRRHLATLPEALQSRIRWIQQLPARPLRGVILANEVLDALPCHRFVVGDATVEALGVSAAADGTLGWARRAAGAVLTAAVQELNDALPVPLPPGYVSELCTRVDPWVAGLSACLERGALLLFDYGLPRAQYYQPDRDTGTLICHYKHRAHFDPFVNVGVQDITAWVDFTRVALAGHSSGLGVLGLCTQAAFLLGTGIDEFLAQARDTHEQARLAGEARRLLLPGEMGEAFKLLALGRGIDAPLDCFRFQDLRDSL